MRKTPTKVTFQTLDKKIDGLGQTMGTLGDKLETLTDIVDVLARSTKQGFDSITTKQEFTEFKEDMTAFAKQTGITLFNLDSHARTANERLNAIEKALGPLVQASSFYQNTLREHERRLSLIERAVGLVKQS